MRIKAGVNLDGVHPSIWYAATAYDWLRQALEMGEGTITSAKDSKHSGTSWHPSGYAVDLRTNDLYDTASAELLAAELVAALGPHYDVILEVDHLHIELSPAGLQAFGIR